MRAGTGSQPSISVRLRRARTAAIAAASRFCRDGVVHVVGGHQRQIMIIGQPGQVSR